MLSKHPILSLGTFSRPLRCHGKSDKVYVTKNGEKTQFGSGIFFTVGFSYMSVY